MYICNDTMGIVIIEQKPTKLIETMVQHNLNFTHMC